MKIAFLVCLFLFAACRSDSRSQSTVSESTRAQEQTASLVIKDTAGAGAVSDSILDAMTEGSPSTVTTSRGDTLESQGGVGFGVNGAYALEVYRWNGARFVRIKRAAGHTADGYSEWTTSLRTLLSPVADSGQWVVLQCQVASRDDPWVFGSVFGGPAPWQPRHAWRFDTTAGALREIPTSDVKCAHLLGYED